MNLPSAIVDVPAADTQLTNLSILRQLEGVPTCFADSKSISRNRIRCDGVECLNWKPVFFLSCIHDLPDGFVIKVVIEFRIKAARNGESQLAVYTASIVQLFLKMCFSELNENK